MINGEKKLKCTRFSIDHYGIYGFSGKKYCRLLKYLTAFISPEILFVSNTTMIVSNTSKAAEGGLGSGVIALKKCVYLAFSLVRLFSINATRIKMLSQVSNANSEKKKEPLFFEIQQITTGTEHLLPCFQMNFG